LLKWTLALIVLALLGFLGWIYTEMREPPV
jgi:hypothetical protein